MESIRLNLYVSQSGLCSRRKADELIKAGEITVNHWPQTNPAYEVQPKDTVRYKKTVIKPEALTYIIMNKPEGYITSVSDELNRPTVMELLDKSVKNRVYPVGRLDYNTTGVLLLTNDGDLAQKLAHPRSMVKKVYKVTLKEDVTSEACSTLKRGVYLEDGAARVDSLYQGYDKNVIKVTIHSGRNRIIRRMFEALGYTVKKLERMSFATLTCKNIPLGHSRTLRPAELKKLMALEVPAEKKTKDGQKVRTRKSTRSASRKRTTTRGRSPRTSPAGAHRRSRQSKRSSKKH